MSSRKSRLHRARARSTKPVGEGIRNRIRVHQVHRFTSPWYQSTRFRVSTTLCIMIVRAMRFFKSTLLMSITLAAGCSDSSGTSGINSPSGTNGVSLTARVDGSAWSADPTTIVAGNMAGVLTFSGTNALGGGVRRTIALRLVATAPGTYPIGPPVEAASNRGTVTEGTAEWLADASTGNGTIILGSLTADRATGTFSFNAEPVAATAASGTRGVTEGAFSVTF